MNLKVTVLCHETPFPPSHGGRADMWRRLVAMKKRGVEIQLISWDYGDLTEDRATAIKNVVADHYYIPLERTISFRAQHLLGLLRYPWFASIRWPKPLLPSITQSVKNFRPDFIFLDGWHGALLAFHLRDTLTLPFYYRSHNIEHQYIHAQHKHAVTLRSRLVTYIAGFSVQSLEYKIVNGADKVYDISVDDIKFWNNHGYRHIEHLPPLFCTEAAQPFPVSIAKYDLVFLGNLYTTNNVAGVKWLVDHVMPIVWHERPNTTLLIAGSNPSSGLCSYLNQIGNVILHLNPIDANEVLAWGRIALNPVTTAGGVQIKNVDMLLSGRPIITKSAGIIGLPHDVRKCFLVADSIADFASTILNALTNPLYPCDAVKLGSYFGDEKINRFLQDIERSLRHSRGRLAL